MGFSLGSDPNPQVSQVASKPARTRAPARKSGKALMAMAMLGCLLTGGAGSADIKNVSFPDCNWAEVHTFPVPASRLREAQPSSSRTSVPSSDGSRCSSIRAIELGQTYPCGAGIALQPLRLERLSALSAILGLPNRWFHRRSWVMRRWRAASRSTHSESAQRTTPSSSMRWCRFTAKHWIYHSSHIIFARGLPQ